MMAAGEQDLVSKHPLLLHSIPYHCPFHRHRHRHPHLPRPIYRHGWHDSAALVPARLRSIPSCHPTWTWSGSSSLIARLVRGYRAAIRGEGWNAVVGDRRFQRRRRAVCPGGSGPMGLGIWSWESCPARSTRCPCVWEGWRSRMKTRPSSHKRLSSPSRRMTCCYWVMEEQ